jgi:hypothetical protein
MSGGIKGRHQGGLIRVIIGRMIVLFSGCQQGKPCFGDQQQRERNYIFFNFF